MKEKIGIEVTDGKDEKLGKREREKRFKEHFLSLGAKRKERGTYTRLKLYRE